MRCKTPSVFIIYAASLRSLCDLFLGVINFLQERLHWCVSPFRVAAWCAAENPSNLQVVQWDQLQPGCLSEPCVQTGRGKTLAPLGFQELCSFKCVLSSRDMICVCIPHHLLPSMMHKDASSPSMLQAFLQSKCRREIWGKLCSKWDENKEASPKADSRAPPPLKKKQWLQALWWVIVL